MNPELKERLELLQSAVDVTKCLVDETFYLLDEQPKTLSRLNLVLAAKDRLDAHYDEIGSILDKFIYPGVASSIPQAGVVE